MDVYFSDDYENNYILIEAPSSILETIKKNDELIIKGGEVTIICNNEKCYELKYLETTNTFMMINNPAKDNISKREIIEVTNHTLECQEYTPRKYNIYNILKQECLLTYDSVSGEDNFSSFEIKYTMNDLFSLSELCLNDFNKMINNFGIFEKYNHSCLFDENFLFQILDDILVMISKFNLNYEKIQIDEIFTDNLISINEQYIKILQRLTKAEKYSITQNIFDMILEPIHNNGTAAFHNLYYKLNAEKVKLFCAKNIFSSKKEANFKLEEFAILLKNTLRVSLPFDLINKITMDNFEYNQTQCDDNLFEGYKEFDLRFLKGYCVIYFLKTQREALIKFVDLSLLSEKFRDRLNELFKIKEKWTLQELKVFLADLNITNIEEKLANIARVVNEINPFDNKKQINFYYLKYKLY